MQGCELLSNSAGESLTIFTKKASLQEKPFLILFLHSNVL